MCFPAHGDACWYGAGLGVIFVDGRIDNLHGAGKKYHAEGSTMDPEKARTLRNMQQVNVTSVDFEDFLRSNVAPRKQRGGSVAILRIDIEGYEYTLLRHMLRLDSPTALRLIEPNRTFVVYAYPEPPAVPKGQLPLCRLDLLVIEFHTRQFGCKSPEAAQARMAESRCNKGYAMALQLRDALRAWCPRLRTVLDPDNYGDARLAKQWGLPAEYRPQHTRLRRTGT